MKQSHIYIIIGITIMSFILAISLGKKRTNNDIINDDELTKQIIIYGGI